MKSHELEASMPWRSGNRFSLLVDGPLFFASMLEAIERAQRYVLIELYLMESGVVVDRFIEALIRARTRGVMVKILLDDFGALGLLVKDRMRLQQTQVELAFYNGLRIAKGLHNLLRDHRKLFLVDGVIAYVGGAGLTDDFDQPETQLANWHETMVSIEGPIVMDWQRLFCRTWRVCRKDPLDLPSPTAREIGTQRGRVSADWGILTQQITRSVIRQIAHAKHRVWIATAYFVPAMALRRALRRAALHGIDVRLLLPGPVTDHPSVRHVGRMFYGRLLRNGVRIFEYQPRFLHAKAILCDNWASIGSCNLDSWNLRWNLEANQEIDDVQFAEQLAAMFTNDFIESHEYLYSNWCARPWHSRLLEFFWGTIGRWLLRLKHPYRNK